MEHTKLIIPSEVIALSEKQKKVEITETELTILPDRMRLTTELPLNTIHLEKIIEEEASLILHIPYLPPAPQTDFRYLIVMEGSTPIPIYYTQIYKIVASDHDVMIHWGDNKENITKKTLHWCEEKLPEDMFMKIHNSYMVAKLHIMSSHIKKGRSGWVKLTDGKTYSISRQHTDYFLEWKKREIKIPSIENTKLRK